MGLISFGGRAKIRAPIGSSREELLRALTSLPEVADLDGTLRADTSGGSLRFAHIEGEVDAHTSGGSIVLEGGGGPAPSANVTAIAPTTIEATISVHKNAKAGVAWDVRVTNPDGSSATLADGLTVNR